MKNFILIWIVFLSTAIIATAQKNKWENGLFWELKNGVLTISGNGAMKDYSHPWVGEGRIEKVIIENGVTSIGDWAFCDCSNLTTVTIPNSVTSIGKSAFWKCSSLTSVTIPNSVTSIGESAFGGCSSLTSVIVPNSVTSIEKSTFDGCSSLASVTISNSVTSIGESAFFNCSSLTSVTIPPFVTSVGKFAFVNCSSLTSITIQNPELILERFVYDWNSQLSITKDSKLYNIMKAGGYDDVIEYKNGSTTYYKVRSGSRYGLVNAVGRVILPAKLDAIEQCGAGFLRFRLNGYWGIVNYAGKVVIPTERGYTKIGDYDTIKKIFSFTKRDYYGVCNEKGNEISVNRILPTLNEIKNKNNYTSVVEMFNGKRKFYVVSKGGCYGLTDAYGKVIVPAEMETLEPAGNGYLRYKLNGFWGLMNYAGKVIIDTDRGYTSIGDFKTFNKRFPYTMNGYKGECDINGRPVSKIKVETPKQQAVVKKEEKPQKQEGSKTQTIIVEHHRDPIPVQQWQDCWACCGSGKMGCDFCGGSGTKYIGDRLQRCPRCNMSGEIPCNICYGRKGQYITVYQ